MNTPITSLSIDLETRSGADIAKSGVYRYAEDEHFDILLFGASINHEPVAVYDLASGESIPEEILQALTDSSVIKTAYNASFERVCLSAWLRKRHPEYLQGKAFLDPKGWHCTMVWSAYNGLPVGLEKTGAVLGLEQQKMKEGKSLIRLFCCPRKEAPGTETRLSFFTPPGISFASPADYPDKWAVFKAYNRRDVEAELQIQDRLQKYPVPEQVWEEYALDQEINDRVIRLDPALVSQAVRIDDITRANLISRLQTLTGLENPNSVAQLKQYLNAHGIDTPALGKKEAQALLETAPEPIRTILSLRLQTAKSSVKKYAAMENAVCRDGRCRGMFQFYGASRSGRWAGRLIQLQNLPRNHMPDLDEARELTRAGDYESLSMLYGGNPGIPNVLSELIRTAFIPEEGKKFIVADFSAVEARALAHLAGEKWREETFRRGGDIYCASAEKMFKVKVEKHGQNAELRQKGKIAELALGYGGSTGALKAMGAIEMGLQEDELQPMVSAWREANPNIVSFWWRIDEAVKEVIRTCIPRKVNGIRFTLRNSTLFITLPGGRKLAYLRPWTEPSQYGGESITYMGTDMSKKWTRIESYGPKFVENIIQAICRDLLAEAMQRLTAKNHKIVGHVHDEVIIETEKDTTVEEICEEMQKSPPWLPGIELRADGYECGYYMKL